MDVYVIYLMVIGVFATAVLTYKLMDMLWKVTKAAARATSFLRFALTVKRVHGWRKDRHWLLYVPGIWFGHLLDELSSKSVSSSGATGVWNGIGDWTVFPKPKD